MRIRKIGVLAALMLASPASAQSDNEVLKRMLAGGPMMEQGDLDAARAEAKKHPLGSKKNPVRAAGPLGQQSYLSRLRCADGHAPAFARAGNLGTGVYASIIDDYVVDCGASAPGRTHVIMDLYFPGYVEDEPVAGFTILPQA